MRGHHHNQRNNNTPRLAKLYVRGWAQSGVSGEADGGQAATLTWLEKKSGRKIVKSWKENDALVISVNPDEENRFTHLNGFQFAGVKVSVSQSNNTQPPSGPKNQQTNRNQNQNQNQHQNTANNNHDQNSRDSQNSRGGRGGRGGSQNDRRRNDSMQVENDTNSSGVDEIEQALVSVIRQNYWPQNKFLNLSGLPQKAELQTTGLVAQPASKVFAALFVCCETKVFETPLKRQQMVESLSLGHNGLITVKDCIAAAGTFNHIKNLDLQNNNISDVGELRYWRNKFPNLEHLVLTGNPIDADPETFKKMKQWYPKLKQYNNQPIPDEQAQLQPPQANVAAISLLPNDPHPQIEPGSTYGQPAPDKPGDMVMKEQMALRLSYETRLNLKASEECLIANQFNYDLALKDLQNLFNQGKITDSLLWTPQQQ